MKIRLIAPYDTPLTLMRRAGYAFQRKEGAEQSYIRELARGGYPRFHIYIRSEKSAHLINIHIDQKSHTYGEETRHHGEYTYEGALKIEVDRLLTHWGEHASIV